MAAYSALLSPFRLGRVALKNRVFSAAHAPGYLEGGVPGMRYKLYHEEKAKGGLALTMFGGSANVARDSGSIFGQIYLGSDANPAGRFELYRVGDALAGRDIHAAIHDSLRLCSAL
jgi:2,4-dienoyl-CoA reductase-like NADH-dependent reductase (Old Yellow Enzyme family)